MLLLGGILPLALAIVLVKKLPESVRFLTVRGADPAKISAILGRISPELATVAVRPPLTGTRMTGLLVKHLFTDGRAVGTLLLWVPYFMNLLLMFLILSWLPAFLRQARLLRPETSRRISGRSARNRAPRACAARALIRPCPASR